MQVGESSSIGDNYVNEGVQVSLVSATFPQQLEKNIGDVLPVCMIYYCQLGLLLGNKSQVIFLMSSGLMTSNLTCAMLTFLSVFRDIYHIIYDTSTQPVK